jgi:CheY-like chemotaxis protein
MEVDEQYTTRTPKADSAGGRFEPGIRHRSGDYESVIRPARVLIADDNVDAAVALAMFLEAIGYEVHAVHDGSTALAAARELRPDAILLDIAMPQMKGDEVCRALRQESWTEHVLIAAVTGFGTAEDRRRSLDAGFDYHMVKPLDPWRLADLLQSL